MREPRYWQSGHPEREGFATWVRVGFGALHPRDGAARGAVWVRPYQGEGKPVAGHWRSPPPSGSGSSARALPPGAIQLANWRRSLWDRLTRSPSDGRGGPGRRPNDRDGRTPRPTLPPPAGADDPVGQRIDRLLRDRLTTPDPDNPVLQHGEFHWRRDGGPSLRERDITEFRPTEMRIPENNPNARIYRLDDNRQILIRPSPSRVETRYPTLDVQQRVVMPNGRDQRRTLHKIRYRLTD